MLQALQLYVKSQFSYAASFLMQTFVFGFLATLTASDGIRVTQKKKKELGIWRAYFAPTATAVGRYVYTPNQPHGSKSKFPWVVSLLF
jgi:hypothetical protein